MNDKILLIDVDKCVSCYACEVACKQEHELPLPSRWCQIITIGPRQVQGQLCLDFVPVCCVHCDDPICSYFCHLGAITKRGDGPVVIDEDKCSGCGLCVYGCPYGAIYLDQGKNTAGKCSLCASRLNDGLEPSCVQHCLSGALQLVTRGELDAIAQETHVARLGRVGYISSKWKLSLLAR